VMDVTEEQSNDTTKKSKEQQLNLKERCGHLGPCPLHGLKYFDVELSALTDFFACVDSPDVTLQNYAAPGSLAIVVRT
ncbi:unnamed protein product, partial [Didymodactylos carnosus]